MTCLTVILLLTCFSIALGAPSSSLDAKHNAEKVTHVIGPLSVTSSSEFDILTNSSSDDSGNTRQQRQTTHDVILEDLKSLSSKLSETYDSQKPLRRSKRQAKDKAHLTVVSLDGNIDQVNLGPLRASLNK
ncbi:hypothetical protein L9F63_019776 [Diploptera punctata]|uniref:Uncharacterized protein n=1 Tax=Diploptera punctata TaxID=6984 RepID=A0AAD7ZTV4_DIPPU|nr:hypothetical protein L9F63_019776 [Diploptera punctata]